MTPSFPDCCLPQTPGNISFQDSMGGQSRDLRNPPHNFTEGFQQSCHSMTMLSRTAIAEFDVLKICKAHTFESKVASFLNQILKSFSPKRSFPNMMSTEERSSREGPENSSTVPGMELTDGKTTKDKIGRAHV